VVAGVCGLAVIMIPTDIESCGDTTPGPPARAPPSGPETPTAAPPPTELGDHSSYTDLPGETAPRKRDVAPADVLTATAGGAAMTAPYGGAGETPRSGRAGASPASPASVLSYWHSSLAEIPSWPWMSAAGGLRRGESPCYC
jgi:hypothetical protein